MFVVRDAGSRVVGRVNVVDILDGSADLGYRIAEDAGGRGYAREAARLALQAAADRGVRQVTAMTTVGNVASRRVLEANGFEPVAAGEPAEVEVEGQLQRTVHFRWTRSPKEAEVATSG
jgi:ribosomal-protein-alanine N-acetyltransferase